MSAADYEKLYQRLYRLFDRVTPLKADCGALCGRACCRGDADAGMLLFPHETTRLPVKEADGRRYVLCGGECRRADRPLSCRIFPFFPAADETGRISAVPDPRGFQLCPLVRQADAVRFDPRFLRRVRAAGRLLAKDEACLSFLREVSSGIEDISRLNALLSPGSGGEDERKQ